MTSSDECAPTHEALQKEKKSAHTQRRKLNGKTQDNRGDTAGGGTGERGGEMRKCLTGSSKRAHGVGKWGRGFLLMLVRQTGARRNPFVSVCVCTCVCVCIPFWCRPACEPLRHVQKGRKALSRDQGWSWRRARARDCESDQGGGGGGTAETKTEKEKDAQRPRTTLCGACRQAAEKRLLPLERLTRSGTRATDEVREREE